MSALVVRSFETLSHVSSCVIAITTAASDPEFNQVINDSASDIFRDTAFDSMTSSERVVLVKRSLRM
jgi:hypothetical protein